MASLFIVMLEPKVVVDLGLALAALATLPLFRARCSEVVADKTASPTASGAFPLRPVVICGVVAFVTTFLQNGNAVGDVPLSIFVGAAFTVVILGTFILRSRTDLMGLQQVSLVLAVAACLSIPFAGTAVGNLGMALSMTANLLFLVFAETVLCGIALRYGFNAPWLVGISLAVMAGASFVAVGTCELFRAAAPAFEESTLVAAVMAVAVLALFLRFVTEADVLGSWGMRETAPTGETGLADSRLQMRVFSLSCRYGFTKREEEVCALLAQGHNVAAIEEILVVSNSTAKSHVAHIYKKMGVHSIQEYSLMGQVNGEYARNGDTILAPLRTFGEQFGENLEFRTDCPVTHLIIEDGKVAGAFAKDKDGKVTKVTAQSVILATGGFSNNAEYHEKYMNRPYNDVVFYGFEGRDGDALRMTAPLNPRLAAPACMNYALGCIEGTHSFDEEVNVWFAWNPLLYVDSHGNRFMDEGLAVSMDSSLRNISIMTAGRCYAIADENTVGAWAAQGAYDYGTGVTDGNLMESIEKCSGIVKADTLGELASVIGVEEAALQASVDQWNAIGKGEADPVYHTAAETAALAPVTTGPFYAAQLRASAYGTGGGLATNKEFRVITQDLQPIDGLFAIGTDNGSCYYRDYPMTAFAAFQQGFCATGGRLAAEAAVGKTA